VLYRFDKFERLLLMGERMTACLLRPGRHRIIPNPDIEGPTCGLLPIGGDAGAVWTSGLRWNLRGGPLRFGGLVSSSNQLTADADGQFAEVTITTTHPVIWTTVLRPEGWPRAPPALDGFRN
jgi:thiamine pyrophosphokinase